mgnify:CR=1 FL=1
MQIQFKKYVDKIPKFIMASELENDIVVKEGNKNVTYYKGDFVLIENNKPIYKRRRFFLKRYKPIKENLK